MNEQLQQLLQLSAKLYEHLNNVPNGEERESYIEKINVLLDERGVIIEALAEAGFKYDPSQKMHSTLAELDKGINARLNKVLVNVKNDLKNLQKSKKNESQYMNPYAQVRTMDGTYYDKKN